MSFEGKSQQEKWQMDGILKILKKQNSSRASSAPALELNTIIFKHVFWYKQQISGERLQDHWSSGLHVLKANMLVLCGQILDMRLLPCQKELPSLIQTRS